MQPPGCNGTVAGKAERYEEALENFERALEINPKDSEAAMQKVLSLQNLKNMTVL